MFKNKLIKDIKLDTAIVNTELHRAEIVSALVPSLITYIFLFARLHSSEGLKQGFLSGPPLPNKE